MDIEREHRKRIAPYAISSAVIFSAGLVCFSVGVSYDDHIIMLSGCGVTIFAAIVLAVFCFAE